MSEKIDRILQLIDDTLSECARQSETPEQFVERIKREAYGNE